MTDEEQRIAIAEFCGWKEIIPEFLSGLNPGNRVMAIPDYLNDLNAMHCAEDKLFGEVGWVHYSHVLLGDNVHASARERAQCLLRTIGKWKDQP